MDAICSDPALLYDVIYGAPLQHGRRATIDRLAALWGKAILENRDASRSQPCVGRANGTQRHGPGHDDARGQAIPHVAVFDTQQ